jgi:hypothetical protein
LVEFISDLLEPFVCGGVEVESFGEVLPEKAVDVLVAAALPGECGSAK